ncbi:PRC-barrel domain-containing protein [Marivita sp. S0852]|uniref:PRC-barrel domain-containing protein n=1 Tax=Marivita sp. S0852 TaxID=3373893 RepID=UPI00398231DB
MKRLIAAALALPLAGAAIAQTSQYTEVDDIDVVGANGQLVGEIETILIDGSGMPAAMVVEVDDGFLDIGDTEVIVPMDALTWDNGRYTTTMTSEDMETLPVWDD